MRPLRVICRLNALLLTFDVLPLSLLGCYGVEWIETPHFDELSAQGLTFDFCFATQDLSPGLVVADSGETVTWQSGDELSPRLDGDDIEAAIIGRWTERITAAFPNCRLQTSRETSLIDALDHGFLDTPLQSLGELSLQWLRLTGLPEQLIPPSALFDLYLEEFFTPVELRDAVAHWLKQPPEYIAEHSNKQPLSDFDWVTEHVEAMLELGLLDRDHRPADTELTRFRLALAGAIISQLDTQLGELLEALEPAVLSDETVVIVAGLTGQLLMQHPHVAQGMPPLVDERLHVPLWVWSNEPDWSGVRRRELTETAAVIDLLQAFSSGRTPIRSACHHDVSGIKPASDKFATLPVSDAILWRWADGPGALRTSRHHCVVDSWQSIETGGDRDDEVKHWLFLKPGDIWDLRDESSQSPEMTRTLAEQLCSP
ncbi:MAG: hypothetical protein R3C01_12555 [Planctomycetaceae bacterium]